MEVRRAKANEGMMKSNVVPTESSKQECNDRSLIQIAAIALILVVGFYSSSGVASAIAPGWSEPATPLLNISNISTQGIRASLIQDGNGTYWMVREGKKAVTENNNLSIFSSIDGINWSTPIWITNNSSADSTPSLMNDSVGKLWVSWGSGSGIYVMNSSDGTSWSAPLPVYTNASSLDQFSSLIQDKSGTFWVAWESTKGGGGDYDVWIANSSDGSTWNLVTSISAGAGLGDCDPSLLQDRNNMYWIVWVECSNGELYISNSSNGVNWSAPTQITFDSTSADPSLIQDKDGMYWIAWRTSRSGNRDIWLMNSTDGTTWTNPTQITTNTSEDNMPTLIRDKNGTFWVAWESDRLGGGVVAIFLSHLAITLTSPIGNETLSGIYNITWNVADVDKTNNTFDIYYNTTNGTNWTLITSGLNNTTTSYLWNTTEVPDGANYTVKVTRVNSYAGNATYISGNFSIDNPPQSVTNLTNTTGITWINWTWENPSNPDFNHTMVYINGSFITNVSGAPSTASYYNNTTLSANTSYKISTHAVDTSGDINSTWVNQTTTTLPYPPPTIVNWSNNKTNDVSLSITINESEQVMFNITADQPITTYSWYEDGVNQNWNYDNNTTSWATNGTYEVNASVTNANGTSANKSWTITVNDITAPVVYGLTNDTPMQTTVNLSWSCDDGDVVNYSIYQNGVFLDNTTNKYYNVTGLSADTTYEFNVSAIDDNGLKGANDTVSVTTLEWPTPSITPWGNNKTNNQTLSITINESEAVTFNVTANQSVNYSWYRDGVDQGIHYDNFTTSWSATGSKTVAVNATNANGTSGTVTWNVTVQHSTCSAQGGNICSSGQSCSGSWASASDTSRCCIGTCYYPSTGGGGYATPTPTPTPVVVVELELKKQIQSIEGGKSEVVTFEEPESDVTGIKINVKNNVSGVEITIQKLSGAPTEVMKKTPSPMITGATVETYSYLNISTTNITDEDITNASINFTVNKSWILEEEIDEDSVTLHRYNNTTANWTALNTSKTGEDNTSVYYEAETPGFSIFVITGDREAVVEPTPTAAPVPTLTPVLAPTPTPAVAVTPTPPVTPEPAVPEPRPLIPEYTEIIILAAVAFIVALSFLYYEKRRISRHRLKEIASGMKKEEMEKSKRERKIK